MSEIEKSCSYFGVCNYRMIEGSRTWCELPKDAYCDYQAPRDSRTKNDIDAPSLCEIDEEKLTLIIGKWSIEGNDRLLELHEAIKNGRVIKLKSEK